MIRELLSDLRYRFRALFHRADVEQELQAEIQFHLEQESAKHISAGMTPAQARLVAQRSFGGIELAKEQSRDGRGISLIEMARQDLRYAIRSLRRNPGFTAAVILTLGLGIGANAAMFGIVDRLLFRDPAMLHESGRVHRVYFARQDRGQERINANTGYTRYLDLRQSTTSFDALAAFRNRIMPVGVGTEAREMRVGVVSASFFDFFDATPVIGRTFTAAEDSIPAGAPVAVLGYGYWQRQYGGRADALGQQLQVGTVSYTIIGVMPRGFNGIVDDAPPVLFIPITSFAASNPFDGNWYTHYNWGWMSIMARRKPGITVAQASSDLTQAYQRSYLKELALSPGTTPLAVAQPRALAAPVLEQRGPQQDTVTKVATWVSGVTLIVLLIACANVTNLMLARAVRRRREVALRLALGVSRGRLMLQLVTENLLLAGGGAVAGLLLAHWGDALLRSLFLPQADPEGGLIDPRTLVFAITVTLIAGLLTSLAPILQARRTDLAETLKAGARQGGHHRSRTRSALLLLQGTLSVVLLVGAALFLRSLQHVRAIPLGYDVDPVLYVSPNLRGIAMDADARDQLGQHLAEVARSLPGVEQATVALTAPFWDEWTLSLFVQGIDSVDRLGTFSMQAATPEFFATVGTRILRGRPFTAADQAGAPPVVVVSAAMAGVLWPGQDALGQCLRIDTIAAPCSTVIGIAENIKQRSLTDNEDYHYYLPLEQFAATRVGTVGDNPQIVRQALNTSLFVRLRGSAPAEGERIRKSLQAEMPGASYLTVNPMRDLVDPEVLSWRLGALLFVAFGGLALLVAAIGLYSVIAYDVAQRTQELGVRMALGAQSTDVMRLVVRDGLRFALAGITIGGGLALAAGPWLRPLLYAQSPRDPVVFGSIALILLLVAGIASALPAFRASRVNPSSALRAD